MHNLIIQKRWWHKLIRKLAATEFGIWLLAGRLQRWDKPILKLTQNRSSLTTWLTGLPVVVLETRGAKTGLLRLTPLVKLVDGDKIVLISSSFGSTRHPAWYYNLKMHQDAAISIGDQTYQYRAREAAGAERSRYWEMALEMYPGFRLYERKAGNRTIPVMVLEPK